MLCSARRDISALRTEPRMNRSSVPRAFVALSSLLLLLSGASAIPDKRSAKPEDTAILVGAGDIADCRDLSGAEATAKLLEKTPGTVMAVGDLAYPDGTAANFECYDRTWGRVKERTRPAPGNHEFHSLGAAFYFEYFGEAAGDPKDGFYSYGLGSWHIIS